VVKKWRATRQRPPHRRPDRPRADDRSEEDHSGARAWLCPPSGEMACVGGGSDISVAPPDLWGLSTLSGALARLGRGRLG